MRRLVAVVGIVGAVAAVGACGRVSRPDTPAAKNPPVVKPLPAQPVKVPPAAALRPGEQFVQVGLQKPYEPVPPAGGTDEYRCFLVDPHITTKSFIMGSQFMPYNGALVHHAILYRIPASEVSLARTVDAGDGGPDDGWTCFGGTGVGSAGRSIAGAGSGTGQAWVASWAPGGRETLLGADKGYEMDPGSQFVMQIHYNLLATNGEPGEVDQTTVRLRLSTSSKIRPLRTTLVAAPIELPCTPQESGPFCGRGEALSDLAHRFGSDAVAMVQGLSFLCSNGAPTPGPTQHCDMPVRRAGTIYAVAGHMHLLGRSIKVELNPGTPGARTLLDVPAFNFDDQAARPLATPVAIKPGDTLRVTCTHDASLRSKLPQLANLKPRYVMWGDGTSDEMCLGIVVWA